MLECLSKPYVLGGAGFAVVAVEGLHQVRLLPRETQRRRGRHVVDVAVGQTEVVFGIEDGKHVFSFKFLVSS